MRNLLFILFISANLFARSINWTDLTNKQTTDATQTELHLIIIPDGQTWKATISCLAVGANTEMFEKSASMSQSGATTTQNGDVIDDFNQPASPYALTFGTTGGLQILGTGAAADTVNWYCMFIKKRLL